MPRAMPEHQCATKAGIDLGTTEEAKKMGLGRIATQNGASLRKLSYRAQGFDSYFDKS